MYTFPFSFPPLVQLDMNSAFIARLVGSKVSLAQPKHTTMHSSSSRSSSSGECSSKSSPSTDKRSWLSEEPTQKENLRNGDTRDGGQGGGTGHSNGAAARVSNGTKGNRRDGGSGSGDGNDGDGGAVSVTKHVAAKSQVYSGFSEAQVYTCTVHVHTCTVHFLYILLFICMYTPTYTRHDCTFMFCYYNNE